MLIAKGGTVNVRNRSKQTPLHLATRYGTAELVQLLLKNGAEVNAKTADGRTPLHDAVRKNQTISAKLLIDAGADLSAKVELHWKGWTPLHFGVRYADREMIELLLSAGAVVDVPEENGYTPLDLATRKRRKDGVIELLREAKEVPKTDENRRAVRGAAVKAGKQILVREAESKKRPTKATPKRASSGLPVEFARRGPMTMAQAVADVLLVEFDPSRSEDDPRRAGPLKLQWRRSIGSDEQGRPTLLVALHRCNPPGCPSQKLRPRCPVRTYVIWRSWRFTSA